MNLKLNGLMYVNGAEVFCENLFVETDEDEFEFEFELGEDIEDDFMLEDILMEAFDEMECCDLTDECDDEYIDVDAMIEDYTEVLLEGDMCSDCIGDLLSAFAIELLGEEVEYGDEEFYF